MFAEQRILRLQPVGKPRVLIDWDAIQQAGDALMTMDGTREHAFVLAGSVVQDAQGQTALHARRALTLPEVGTPSAFDVSPRLARDISSHPYQQGEQCVGITHSHRRHHRPDPSREDFAYARQLGRNRIGMVIRLNEDAHGRRDGGGKLSVFDGDGFVDYTVVGNGHSQSFRAGDRGGRIDVSSLRSPVSPPRPEKIQSSLGLAA